MEGAPSHPRILVFSVKQRKLSSLSPFQRKEGCDRFGKVSRCDKLRDGGIEVEFVVEEDAKRAMTATEFVFTSRDGQGRRLVKLPISVSAHRSKNHSRGVIYCADLEGVDDDEVVDGLSGFGVVSARRMKFRDKKTGVLAPTNNIILTFDQLELPRDVLVGYVRVKVRPYHPSPMRCFKCLRFGHTRDHCRNDPTCGKCAASDHTGEDCKSETRKCVNCDENQKPHNAFDQSCPAFLKEKEIIAIKVTERISFREAREKYNISHPKRSFAAVTRETRPNRPVAKEQSNVNQLISLLQSFGLQLVAGPGVSPEPVATAPPSAAAPQSNAATQTSPITRGGTSEDGWTLVSGRRGSAPKPRTTSSAGIQTTLPSSPPIPARPSGPAVTEALRRAEEDKGAREARRARLAEKSREAGRSPGVEPAPSAPSVPQGPQVSRSPSTGWSPPMGPPPPAPPLRLPPPPPPPGAVVNAGKQAGPPASPGRSSKRTLPREDSSSEVASPRSRQRFQPGATGRRTSSADGRLRPGHSRIQFGESPWSGAAENF